MSEKTVTSPFSKYFSELTSEIRSLPGVIKRVGIKRSIIFTKVKKTVVFTLIVLAVLLFLSDYSGPENPLLFNIKRLQEKQFMSLKNTPQDKADYYLYLLDRRLKELSYLPKSKKFGFILPSALRYSTTAGELTSLINTNNLDSYTPLLKAKFIYHKVILEELLRSYPYNLNESESKYITDDINYLTIYLQQLEK